MALLILVLIQVEVITPALEPFLGTGTNINKSIFFITYSAASLYTPNSLTISLVFGSIIANGFAAGLFPPESFSDLPFAAASIIYCGNFLPFQILALFLDIFCLASSEGFLPLAFSLIFFLTSGLFAGFPSPLTRSDIFLRPSSLFDGLPSPVQRILCFSFHSSDFQ